MVCEFFARLSHKIGAKLAPQRAKIAFINSAVVRLGAHRIITRPSPVSIYNMDLPKLERRMRNGSEPKKEMAEISKWTQFVHLNLKFHRCELPRYSSTINATDTRAAGKLCFGNPLLVNGESIVMILNHATLTLSKGNTLWFDKAFKWWQNATAPVFWYWQIVARVPLSFQWFPIHSHVVKHSNDIWHDYVYDPKEHKFWHYLSTAKKFSVILDKYTLAESPKSKPTRHFAQQQQSWPTLIQCRTLCWARQESALLFVSFEIVKSKDFRANLNVRKKRTRHIRALCCRLSSFFFFSSSFAVSSEATFCVCQSFVRRCVVLVSS